MEVDKKYFRKDVALKTETCRKRLTEIRGWQCECCKLTVWQGQKIPLQIHHINGDHLDNTYDNLQLLCPNCHAQTDNYAGRNKQQIHYTDEQFVELAKQSYSIRDTLLKLGIRYSAKVHYDRAYKLIKEHNITFLKRPSSSNKEKSKSKIKKEIKDIKEYVPRFCKICGKELNNRQQYYCSSECSHKAQQKAERPEREILKNKIRDIPFTTIGKEYNVSDNTIRKWCKDYNLPHSKKEINKISDEDWKNV